MPASVVWGAAMGEGAEWAIEMIATPILRRFCWRKREGPEASAGTKDENELGRNNNTLLGEGNLMAVGGVCSWRRSCGVQRQPTEQRQPRNHSAHSANSAGDEGGQKRSAGVLWAPARAQ